MARLHFVQTFTAAATSNRQQHFETQEEGGRDFDNGASCIVHRGPLYVIVVDFDKALWNPEYSINSGPIMAGTSPWAASPPWCGSRPKNHVARRKIHKSCLCIMILIQITFHIPQWTINEKTCPAFRPFLAWENVTQNKHSSWYFVCDWIYELLRENCIWYCKITFAGLRKNDSFLMIYLLFCWLDLW